ncbi:MAG: peptide deformylase [Candidatus Woesebacteria bacterium]|jgi:peptide deformylase
MRRKIVSVTDASLREKSKPIKKIDKKVKALIKDLKDTLNSQKDPEGVGLAAPQIGKNYRVFAIKPKDEIKIFVNPKIVSSSKKGGKKKDSKQKYMEGCLSLPHYYGPLRRLNKITIKYTTEKGKQKKETLTGFPAHIVQHEIDHLNGIIFVDRLLEQDKPLYELVDDEWQEVDI